MLTWSRERSAALDARLPELAVATVLRLQPSNPPVQSSARGEPTDIEEAESHLCYLSEALSAGRPSLFAKYVEWWSSVLANRGAPPEKVKAALEVLCLVVREYLPADTAAMACHYIEGALARAANVKLDVPTFLRSGEPHVVQARAYLKRLLSGRHDQAREGLQDLLASGLGLSEICEHILQPAQAEVGRLWQLNRISVAQEHYCTEAARTILNRLTALATRTERKGRVLLAAAVEGEQHELGMRMIADLMEVDGWDVHFIGANTPGGAIFQLAQMFAADVVALSATLPINLHAVESTIRATGAVLPQVKVVVGGHAFDEHIGLAALLGADLHVSGAADAVGAINAVFEGKTRSGRSGWKDA